MTGFRRSRRSTIRWHFSGNPASKAFESAPGGSRRERAKFAENPVEEFLRNFVRIGEVVHERRLAHRASGKVNLRLKTILSFFREHWSSLNRQFAEYSDSAGDNIGPICKYPQVL